jgi:membrane protease YdiL (CAAX protease family)
MSGNIESISIESKIIDVSSINASINTSIGKVNNSKPSVKQTNTITTSNTEESIKPWSAKATLALTLLLLILYMVISGIAVTFAGINGGFEAGDSATSQAFFLDGDFISVSYLMTSLCLTPIVFLWARKRKLTTASAYLGLNKLPDKKTFINFNLALITYFIFSYVAIDLLAIETPQMMIDVYNTTDYVILLLITVVIAAPIFEEIVFRGFIFKGLKHSPLRATGAIVITSILFTLIHGGQYEIAVLGILFPLAVILGLARHRSGGILLPIYLHFANNLYSSVEMYLLMN